jgi:hypothetical protein
LICIELYISSRLHIFVHIIKNPRFYCIVYALHCIALHCLVCRYNISCSLLKPPFNATSTGYLGTLQAGYMHDHHCRKQREDTAKVCPRTRQTAYPFEPTKSECISLFSLISILLTKSGSRTFLFWVFSLLIGAILLGIYTHASLLSPYPQMEGSLIETIDLMPLSKPTPFLIHHSFPHIHSRSDL